MGASVEGSEPPMTTGEPTLDLMMALTDLAERLTVMALLLLIAFAFLRRWVVPRQTVDDLVQPYKDMAEKLGNGMNGKLDQVIEASQRQAEAVDKLTASIERQTSEQTNSRVRMVEKVGELATMLATQAGLVQRAAEAATKAHGHRAHAKGRVRSRA